MASAPCGFGKHTAAGSGWAKPSCLPSWPLPPPPLLALPHASAGTLCVLCRAGESPSASPGAGRAAAPPLISAPPALWPLKSGPGGLQALVYSWWLNSPSQEPSPGCRLRRSARPSPPSALPTPPLALQESHRWCREGLGCPACPGFPRAADGEGQTEAESRL